MKCNMGSTDRVLRGIVGVAIIAAGFYFSSWWGLIGLVPLFTSAVAWCPAYVPFNISTASKE